MAAVPPHLAAICLHPRGQEIVQQRAMRVFLLKLSQPEYVPALTSDTAPMVGSGFEEVCFSYHLYYDH